jgi:broad specificity phosphatase PhoE
MRWYLVRHADPDPPRDALTPQGEREAEALAERMAVERIDHLHSSTTGR